MYLSKLNLKTFKNKTALVRIDLNVEKEKINENYRIIQTLPTLKKLLANKIKIILLAHYGRPKKYQKDLSLEIFKPFLEDFLKQKIYFINQKNFGQILKNNKDFIVKIKNRFQIFLLENLRFYEAEEKNDKFFAKTLASLGDFYINEAFSASHRKHASVYGITKYLPSYLGYLAEQEIINLNNFIKMVKTTKPFIIILGGAKIKDKLPIIQNFYKNLDFLLLGGGPANTFFYFQKIEVFDSLIEKDKKVKQFVLKHLNDKKIILPLDVKISNKEILDIGEKTISVYKSLISKANLVIFNGPLGFFEKEEFSKGTKEILKTLFKNKKAKILIGGGETVNACLRVRRNLHNLPKNIFLSTGGGAMLEYLSGKKLPGLFIIDKNYQSYF